ncbi:MAG TPA: CSLREA domain-containing protein [Candidatus Binatia bacterium]|nr:CSLREA domain-containing protein [Candidatus Binatia bacterium]
MLFLLLACFLPPLAGVAAAGGLISVTTTDDELNADGDCSLREADSYASGSRSMSRPVPLQPMADIRPEIPCCRPWSIPARRRTSSRSARLSCARSRSRRPSPGCARPARPTAPKASHRSASR